MRSIATGLRSYLDASAATSNAPVWLSTAEQGTAVPFVVIQRSSTEHYDTLGPQADTLISETFRITTYGNTGLSAHTIADAIAEDLDDYSGAMGTDRVAEAVYIEDESGGFDPPAYADSFAFADVIVQIQHSPAA